MAGKESNGSIMVFCSECKHFLTLFANSSDDYRCQAVRITHTKFYGQYSTLALCKDINKNNDCSLFEKKKSLWKKIRKAWHK